MSKYLPLLFCICIFMSCSSDKKSDGTHKDGDDSIAYIDGNLHLEIGNSTHVDGIRIKNFTADTAVNNKEEGIRVQFSVEVQKTLIDQLQTNGYDALIIDVTCKGEEGKSFSYLETYLPKLSGMIVYPDKHVVFAHASNRSLAIDIPYRKLELTAGLKPITISLVVYPVSFDKDSSRIETKHINRIGTNALITKTFTANIQAPQLQKNTITLNTISIHTSKKAAGSYDFALGGTGYPDPYWQLWCGEDLLFYSPFQKNTLTVNEPCTTHSFYTCKKDVLRLSVLDYDKGPFNTDDEIERLEGTITDLEKLKKYKGKTVSCSIEIAKSE